MHRFPALLSAALLAPYHSRMRMPPPLLSAGRRAARRQRSSGRDDSALAAVMPSPPPPQESLDGPRPTDVAGFVSLAATHHKLGQPRRAYLLYDEAMQAGVSAAPVYAAVTRSLLKLQRVDLALELQRVHGEKQLPDVRSATALLGALCRQRQWDEAAALVVRWESEAAAGVGTMSEAAPLGQAVCSTMVPTLALSHLRNGDVAGALPWLRRLPATAATAAPPMETLTELIRACGKARCLPGVYLCLDCLEAATPAREAVAEGEEKRGAEAQSAAESELMQALANALVHDVSFVTGGVSMATLPQIPLQEAAFVGRSNVGKSSLVNMLLGRRGVAYTSKTPGKTQQYNFFSVNPHRTQGEPGHFHLVDMPGLGFARVPAKQRASWRAFLARYLGERPQLKLLVHLVDGQVGPVATDEALMQMVAVAQQAGRIAPTDGSEGAESEGGGDGGDGVAGGGDVVPLGWTYAVVLTKADKRRGRGSTDRAERDVRAALERAVCLAHTCVVRTSAKSRLGRDEMWRLLKCVVLPDVLPDDSDDPLPAPHSATE